MPNNNLVITIAREYGSGGRLIGKRLAELLGVPFYDKEIIALAAEQSRLVSCIIFMSATNHCR